MVMSFFRSDEGGISQIESQVQRMIADARHTFDLELDRRETTDLGPNFQPHEARFEEAAGDRGYALPATFENPGESLLKALDELGYGGGEDGG